MALSPIVKRDVIINAVRAMASTAIMFLVPLFLNDPAEMRLIHLLFLTLSIVITCNLSDIYALSLSAS